jgi:hypothetical protein
MGLIDDGDVAFCMDTQCVFTARVSCQFGGLG